MILRRFRITHFNDAPERFYHGGMGTVKDTLDTLRVL